MREEWVGAMLRAEKLEQRVERLENHILGVWSINYDSLEPNNDHSEDDLFESSHGKIMNAVRDMPDRLKVSFETTLEKQK